MTVTPKLTNKNHFVIIFVTMLLFVLQGCTPKTEGRSKKSSSSNNATTDSTAGIPQFSHNANFIQNGSTVVNTSLAIDVTYTDTFQMRGKSIDNYLRNVGTNEVLCLVIPFKESHSNKVLVLSAIPKTLYSFVNKTLEYYLSVSPSDETSNKSFCQKTSLITTLNSAHPTLPIIYSLQNLCPLNNCLYTTFISNGLELFTNDSSPLVHLSTSHLYFSVSNNFPSDTDGNGNANACNQASDCYSLGLDCCSSGQCVKDLSIKSSVDQQSIAFQNALDDILLNPSNVYLYPQFYNICSQPVVTPTNPTTPTNPDVDAATRLENLSNLYSCTNKVEGEMGICAKTFSNVKVGTTYEAGKDARNFRTTLTNSDSKINFGGVFSNVEQITYGGINVFSITRDEPTAYPEFTNQYIKLSAYNNDNVNLPFKIEVLNKPSGAVNDELIVKYRNDASCTFLNNSLAKCEKHYIQDQNYVDDDAHLPSSLIYGLTPLEKNRKRATDHFRASNQFLLPLYADTTRAITITIDGITQKSGLDWELVVSSPSYIQFLSSPQTKAARGQKVIITFFSTTAPALLMPSKLEAMATINQICSCQGQTQCNLIPVTNTLNQIVDYACKFPESDIGEAPLSQKVYLSSKTVPVRFYDRDTGQYKSSLASSADKQEGNEFLYTSGDYLKPNNLDQYVGFNEIYGTLRYDNNSAKPALEVKVKKGSNYDIIVQGGAVSNCLLCGNDYYSQLTKVFPQTSFAGGVEPMLGQTNRINSSNVSVRSDDLKFGRACLVPATMIPWTHKVNTSQKTQRLGRMAAQHFLYANGYQYDWYGFDYGAVIGSFDGVKWFAIGTNRRIKADTNRLFLAVNAPLGDLSLENTFEVNVHDAILNPEGQNMARTDFESDGAQCQQYHQCSTDNDCATTLGWEYSCAPVSELTTSWPVFDDNAHELPELSRDESRLSQILGTSNQGKRCVYRGRGALCSANYNSVLGNSNYASTTTKAFHACSSANYCQSLQNSSVRAPKFNTKITRYGKTNTSTTRDSFGLGAQLPGRPHQFNATEVAPDTALPNLVSNKIISMCVPGKDVTLNNYVAQNSTVPTTADFQGDRILGIGHTYPASISNNNNYFNGCSTLDAQNNYYHLSNVFDFSSAPEIARAAASQNISTNALSIFKTIFQQKSMTFDLYRPNNSILTKLSYTEARCMRAPGSSCFSDQECAPSKAISDRINTLSVNDADVLNIINKYELLFWQEELICGQATPKDSELYDPKNNTCCRDVGKKITLPSADLDNALQMDQVPGLDMSYNSKNRYSRASTMYQEVKNNSALTPKLAVAIKDQCHPPRTCGNIESGSLNLKNQQRTFSKLASKTSCTGHWVREFANGGHKWETSRFQTFNAKNFQCLNWLPFNSLNASPYNKDQGAWNCANFSEDDPNCPIIQTLPTSLVAKEALNYLGSLELMGVPQIALKTEEHFSEAQGALACKSHPNGRVMNYPPFNGGSTVHTPVPNLFASSLSAKEYFDGTSQLYSAGDSSNFHSSLKNIFSPDTVSTCYPAGTEMPLGSNANLCCSGMINSENNKCQLPDYIDLSVYTNRYISSEAKDLNDALFDEKGFVKDPLHVAQLACAKQMCASNSMATGILISQLKIPGLEESDKKYYRYLEGNSKADNENGLLDLFSRGLKLNTHLYCIPKALAEDSNAANDLNIITCGE